MPEWYSGGKEESLLAAWATPALRPSGRGGVFLSAKIGRIREKNTGREGRTRPHAEGGQRRTKPPMSEPETQNKDSKKKKKH